MGHLGIDFHNYILSIPYRLKTLRLGDFFSKNKFCKNFMDIHRKTKHL